MAEPVQSLMAVKSLAGAVVEASKSMKYQGLFLEKESSYLGEFYNKNKANQLTDEEFQLYWTTMPIFTRKLLRRF